MNILKQSTAATIKLGPFIDDGDGKTAKTGLTISQADIRLSKNGGDFAQTNNATGATHDEFGYYDIPLDTTDTNTLGRLLVAVHESGALPVWQDFLVVTANVYDTLCSTDTFDVNVTALADDVITAGKFDESTAFPLKSADTGSTQVARVGADSDTLETLSDEIAAVKAETALIVADTGTDGVLIGATQGAITWGQQKIIANADGEGALDIVNTGGSGSVGIHTEGVFAGQYNEGTGASSNGTYNIGVDFGLHNQGYTGQLNYGELTGQRNTGGEQDVLGYDPALALEATLTAIKGVGWTNQTLVKIVTDISNISAGSGATPQQVWEYAARTLTAGTNITIPTAADVADAVWDEAISGHTTATTFGGKNQKVVPSETVGDYKADVSSLATAAALTALDRKVDTVDGVVDAIKAETALIVEDTGTTLPATLAGLATTTHVQEVEDKVDTAVQSAGEASYYSSINSGTLSQVASDTAAILVDTGTTLDTKINTIDGIVDDILVDTGTTIPATLTIIDNFIDTEVAAIKAKTDQLTFTVANKVDATATNTSSLAGDVWSYTKRTLTHPSVSAEEPEDSNTLILYRDADIAIELTDLTIPAGAKKYIFTIKDNLDSGDDQAVLQASYAIDGSEVETNTLVYINSAAAPVLTNPVTFTLTDTNITIDLTAEAAALLPRYERGYLNWDLKLVTDAAVTIVLQGLAQIIGTSTRAIE